MGYRALYRKYRPDSFESVVGQQPIVRTLRNIIKENKISHAYLFSGPRGTGKTSIAKIFAKTINCLNVHDGIPCGECSICKQIQNEEVNDVIEIDAASNNGVDEIRDLKSKINLVPTSCKYKIYIIDEVHMLSIGAFNALLKTLEEPPRHVIFILATTEMHKLPLTIISRCQNFNFKKITEEQMQKRLKYIVEQEKIVIDDAALHEIAKTSDGGMRDAIGLLEQLVSFTNNNIKFEDVQLLSSSVSRNEITKIINSVIEKKVEEIFKSIDFFYEEGKDFLKIAEDIVVFLKDMLLYRKAKSYFDSKSTYNMMDYNELLEKLDEEQIYIFINEINKMIADLKISTYPKVIFEINILRLIDEFLIEIKEESCESIKIDCTTNTTIEIEQEKHKNTIEIISKIEAKKDNVVDSEIKNMELELGERLPFKNMSTYKKVIVNNTLALAEKKILNELRDKSGQLETFLINKDFKQAATILLDGKIVGASSQNIIYSYPYQGLVDKADDISDEIEKLINSLNGSKFRVINITDDNWSEVRPYYIKLVKENNKIEVLPENALAVKKETSKKQKQSKEVEEAINMFGEDLIEIK